MFNQTVGRIQALGQLTRGGRAATEAAINRMMNELPYPTTTHSSEAAKNAFDLIQNELDIAMQKRDWSAGPTSKNAPQVPNGSKKLTAADLEKALTNGR
jgi:hypothetical protein